jgi:competence protein CoiA
MRECDTWAEKETYWHRGWKNKFPAECQEFVQYDERSGEKHIADVRAPHGLVIEFQHSPLDPLERAAREHFYGNMVWVVDGARLERDYPRFDRGKGDLRLTTIQGCFLLASPDKCFPAMWLDSSVPVIFDFRGVDESQPPDAMLREQFIEVTPSRPQLPVVQEILALMTEIRAAEAPEARRFAGMPGGRAPRRRYARF